MNVDWIFVVYTLFLVDSLGAIIVAWFGQKWWMHYTGEFGKHFPAAKGWALVYFTLILVIGHLLGFF